MTLIPLELEAPLLFILCGIGLCLILEASGLKEGFRRHGNKSYISLIAFGVVLSVFLLVFRSETIEKVSHSGLIFDSLSRSSILSLCTLTLGVLWITIERLKSANADRGELYALVLFAFFCSILACCATSPSIFACSLLASLSAQIGIIAIRKRRRTSPEIALKIALFCLFLLVLLGAVFAFDAANQPLAVTTCMIAIVLVFSGVVPVQTLFVDILDGAPSYCAAFLASSTPIITLATLSRLANAVTLTSEASEIVCYTLVGLSGLTLCLCPIMALDQRRMSRLIAYLLCSQAGIALMIASLAFIHIELSAYIYGFLFTHFVFCGVGIYAGQNLWKNTRHAFKTWEDFAGAGRQHPVYAGAFFVVLLSVVGFPLTSGFVLRMAAMSFAPPHLRLLFLLIILINVVASFVPVFRLFAFFFGKTTRHELRKHHNKAQKILLLALCASFVILCALAPASILRTVFDLGQ